MSWKWQEIVEEVTDIPPRVQILILVVIGFAAIIFIVNTLGWMEKICGGPIWPPPAVEQVEGE
ncbi:MAG: hypothetical protein WC027_00445 [Candidatus Paceibacterota bacterium]